MFLEYGKSGLLGRNKINVKPITNARPVSIGRGKDQDIVLEDPKCAESHASIRYWENCFVLLNKDSVNGTLLNGGRVEVARVSPGDIIQIGDTQIRSLPDLSRASSDATVR